MRLIREGLEQPGWFPVPGLVGQVLQSLKSGSVPSVEAAGRPASVAARQWPLVRAGAGNLGNRDDERGDGFIPGLNGVLGEARRASRVPWMGPTWLHAAGLGGPAACGTRNDDDRPRVPYARAVVVGVPAWGSSITGGGQLGNKFDRPGRRAASCRGRSHGCGRPDGGLRWVRAVGVDGVGR